MGKRGDDAQDVQRMPSLTARAQVAPAPTGQYTDDDTSEGESSRAGDVETRGAMPPLAAAAQGTSRERRPPAEIRIENRLSSPGTATGDMDRASAARHSSPRRGSSNHSSPVWAAQFKFLETTMGDFDDGSCASAPVATPRASAAMAAPLSRAASTFDLAVEEVVTAELS